MNFHATYDDIALINGEYGAHNDLVVVNHVT